MTGTLRLAGCLLGLLPAAVAAQLAGHVDLDRIGATPVGAATRTLWSAAPALTWRSGSARIELTGDLRGTDAGSTEAGGDLVTSWFHPMGRVLQLELASELRGQAGRGIPDAGRWLAGPRLHLAGPHQGAWLGLQGGADRRGPTVRWEAGAWRSFGRLALQFRGWSTVQSARGTAVDSIGGFPDTLSPPVPGRVRSFTDLGLWAWWHTGRVELAGSSGLRLGLPGSGATPAWWQLDATCRVTERFGLAASAGQQVPDPVLGSTGGRFLRLGVRASLGRSGPLLATAPEGAAGSGVRRVSAAEVEIWVPAAEAQRVDLMSDLTDWRPLAMAREGVGRWRVRLRAGPGLHRLSVRYDGGPWQVPPGLRPVADEFGGESGELVIQEAPPGHGGGGGRD